MNDGAFTRLPEHWSPDESLERMLANAANTQPLPTLRARTLDGVGRELRRANAERTWAFAAWLLVAALVWMQVAASLVEILPSSRPTVSSSVTPQPSSGERSFELSARFFLP